MILGIVSGQKLKITTPVVVASTIKHLEAEFTFTAEWAPYTKYVHFDNGVTAESGVFELVNDRLSQNAGLDLSRGTYKVWVHGNYTDAAGNIHRATSTIAMLTVARTGGTGTEPFPELTPSVVETQVELAHGYATSASGSAEDADESAKSASASADRAEEAVSEANSKIVYLSTKVPATTIYDYVRSGKEVLFKDTYGMIYRCAWCYNQYRAEMACIYGDKKYVYTVTTQGSTTKWTQSIETLQYEGSMTDTVTTDTDKYPSDKAVNDALALKSDTGHKHTTSDITDFPDIPDPVSVTQTLTEGTEIAEVNGTKIYAPEAGGSVATKDDYGTRTVSDGGTDYIATNRASSEDLVNKTNTFKPVVPSNLDYAVKVALAGSNSTTDWTETHKSRAREKIGAASEAGLTSLSGEIAKLANTTETPATAGQVLTATDSGAEYKALPKADRSTLGCFKPSDSYLSEMDSSWLRAAITSKANYHNASNYGFIGKGTLENIKTDLVGRALADTTATAYDATTQASACARLGAKYDGVMAKVYSQKKVIEEEQTIEISLENLTRFNIYILACAGATVGDYGQISMADENGVNRGNITELGNLPANSANRVASAYFGIIGGYKCAFKRWDAPGSTGSLVSKNGTDCELALGNDSLKNYKCSKLSFPPMKGTFYITIYGY